MLQPWLVHSLLKVLSALVSIVAGVGQDQEDAQRQAEELQFWQQSRQDISDEGPSNVEILLVGTSVTSATAQMGEEGLLRLLRKRSKSSLLVKPCEFKKLEYFHI